MGQFQTSNLIILYPHPNNHNVKLQQENIGDYYRIISAVISNLESGVMGEFAVRHVHTAHTTYHRTF